MEISALQAMRASLGHSARPDAFQCGREAAQIAKSQLPDGKFQMAWALGPASPAFQDFVEGVRLVSGDNGLVGFPSADVLTHEIFLPGGRLVCLLQSDYLHVTAAAAPRPDSSITAALTSVISQHRALR